MTSHRNESHSWRWRPGSWAKKSTNLMSLCRSTTSNSSSWLKSSEASRMSIRGLSRWARNRRRKNASCAKRRNNFLLSTASGSLCYFRSICIRNGREGWGRIRWSLKFSESTTTTGSNLVTLALALAPLSTNNHIQRPWWVAAHPAHSVEALQRKRLSTIWWRRESKSSRIIRLIILRTGALSRTTNLSLAS